MRTVGKSKARSTGRLRVDVSRLEKTSLSAGTGAHPVLKVIQGKFY
jgi:hypothetical protein